MSCELPPVLAAWLRRATHHSMRPRLLLSGSTLIAALCPKARIPNDIDYVVTGDFDAALMARTAHEIVALPDASSTLELVESEVIYEYTEAFPGLRAHVIGRLSTGEPQLFLGSVREPDMGGKRLAAEAYQHAERRCADAPTRIN